MKPSTIRLTLIFSFVVMLVNLPSAQAQKESDIVSRLAKALRKCAIDEPEPPIMMRGKITYSKLEFDGVINYHRPNNRIELSMGNMKFIILQNDSMRWSYNSATSEHTITRISKEEFEKENQLQKTLDFASKDLLFYKERGFKLKSLGVQQLDSVKVYALELTKKDKSVITFFVNTRTNLIYKVKSTGDDRYYADYKLIGDYMYPHRMSTTVSGNEMSMAFSDVNIGVTIPDSLFVIPSEALESDHSRKNKVVLLLKTADSVYSEANYELALAKYSEVLKVDNNNFRALNGRGLCKVQNKKYYEAIADFNLALEVVPEGSRAINNRGLAKFYLGDNNGALEDYSEAIKLDTTFSTAYKNRGLLYIRTKRFEEGANDFSHAVKLNSKDGEAHFKFAVAIAQLERYDEAVVSYNMALGNGFSTAELHNYKGVSFFKLEKYDSAAVCFNSAVSMDGKNLQYLENLGTAYYYVENYVQARRHFEDYLKQKDDNADIHNYIGLCKYKEEDYKGAIKDFTKSISLNPKAPVFLDNRASAKEQIDDYEGAIADYSQSITLYPNDASVFYKRGLIKIRTSKKIEGCLDLGTANEMKYEAAKDAIMEYCN